MDDAERQRLESMVAELVARDNEHGLTTTEQSLLDRARLRLEGQPRSPDTVPENPVVRALRARAQRKDRYEAEAERLFPKTEEEKAAEIQAKADAQAAKIAEAQRARGQEAMRRLDSALRDNQARVQITGINHPEVSAFYPQLSGVINTYFQGVAVQNGRHMDFHLRQNHNPIQGHLDRLQRRTR